MEPVELRTDDLLLRFWQPTDAAAVHRACRHPSLRRWAGDVPWLVTARPADALLFGVFGPDGGLLGGADLRDLDRAGQTAELGYWTAPWARGRRVAERAARTLLTWAFDGLRLVRVDWRAAVGNHASRVTGLRLGFRMIGERPGPAREWLATLQPGDPRSRELTGAVRKQARVFGGPPPTLAAAGGLTLRPPARRDEAAIVAAYRDPDVVRWFAVPELFTGADARRYVTQEAPLDWRRGAEAVFVIADRSDAYVGGVDLRVTPDDPEVGEVGFLVAPQARGRGYASAAVREITRWGFDELGLHRVQWRAEVGNEASRRVARKAGYEMEGLLRQSLTVGGRRRDCWVGSALSRDGVAA